MARELAFKIGSEEFKTSPEKIDRKKLYGWTEVLALDDNGNECKLVSMDDGTTIIPKGGIALGIMSPQGEWVLRSQLKAVNPDNTPATAIPSSYSQVNELSETVTPEQLLDYNIVAFYQLDAEQSLIDAIGTNIYAFIYSYSNSYEGSKAFVLVSGEGDAKRAFMLVGALNKFEFVSLNEMSVIDEEIDEEETTDDGDIDFSMF